MEGIARIFDKPHRKPKPHRDSPALEGTEPQLDLRWLNDDEVVGDVAVVIFLGLTGSGKSLFIESLSGQNVKNEELTELAKGTPTNHLEGYRMVHKNLDLWTEKDIVFLDTPGFGHARQSEMRTLNAIQNWLEANNITCVHRLFYFDRVSRNEETQRWKYCKSDTSVKLFKSLCGLDAANRTVVVSPMWDVASGNLRMVSPKERRWVTVNERLWKDFIDRGCKLVQYRGKYETALQVLHAHPEPVTEQDTAFAIEGDKRLQDTEMGRIAFAALQERYENLEISLQVAEKNILHAAKTNNSAHGDTLLQEKKANVINDLKDIADQLNQYNPYKQFRDEVHATLNRPASPDSKTSSDTQIEKRLSVRMRGWSDKLRKMSHGLETIQLDKNHIVVFPNTKLPRIPRQSAAGTSQPQTNSAAKSNESSIIAVHQTNLPSIYRQLETEEHQNLIIGGQLWQERNGPGKVRRWHAMVQQTVVKKHWDSLFSNHTGVSPIRVSKTDIYPEDIVILLLGAAGSGKSSFLSALDPKRTKCTQDKINTNLDSMANEVEFIRFPIPRHQFDLVLVDTPGYDIGGIATLQKISDAIKDSNESQLRFNGMIHFQRIDEPHMDAAAKMAQLSFMICGENNYDRIAFVTTHWDHMESTKDKPKAEKALEDFSSDPKHWKNVLNTSTNGGTFDMQRVGRFNFDKPSDSSDLVGEFLWNAFISSPDVRVMLKLQSEAKQGTEIKNTPAGLLITKNKNVFGES